MLGFTVCRKASQFCILHIKNLIKKFFFRSLWWLYTGTWDSQTLRGNYKQAIIYLFEKKGDNKIVYLSFYSCWRAQITQRYASWLCVSKSSTFGLFGGLLASPMWGPFTWQQRRWLRLCILSMERDEHYIAHALRFYAHYPRISLIFLNLHLHYQGTIDQIYIHLYSLRNEKFCVEAQ